MAEWNKGIQKYGYMEGNTQICSQASVCYSHYYINSYCIGASVPRVYPVWGRKSHSVCFFTDMAVDIFLCVIWHFERSMGDKCFFRNQPLDFDSCDNINARSHRFNCYFCIQTIKRIAYITWLDDERVRLHHRHTRRAAQRG